jgi:hypothetical protein
MRDLGRQSKDGLREPASPSKGGRPRPCLALRARRATPRAAPGGGRSPAPRRPPVDPEPVPRPHDATPRPAGVRLRSRSILLDGDPLLRIGTKHRRIGRPAEAAVRRLAALAPAEGKGRGETPADEDSKNPKISANWFLTTWGDWSYFPSSFSRVPVSPRSLRRPPRPEAETRLRPE